MNSIAHVTVTLNNTVSLALTFDTSTVCENQHLVVASFEDERTRCELGRVPVFLNPTEAARFESALRIAATEKAEMNWRYTSCIPRFNLSNITDSEQKALLDLCDTINSVLQDEAA